jgi:hypothetical protein
VVAAERIAEQGAAAGRGKSVGKGGDQADEGEQHTGPLQPRQPLSRDPQRQAERGQHGRQVDEHHHARCRGVSEAAIDEEELGAEQDAGNDAGAERAVAAEQGDAPPPGPAEQQRRGQRRPDARLGQRRNRGQGELDRHLLQSPQHRAGEQQGVGSRVERQPVRGHGRPQLSRVVD